MAYRIKEGNKERIQQYRGVVIRISGEGKKKRFTVRKMSDNIGVERIFPIESPFIDSIVGSTKYGKVRRAKLYYLRGLTGKKARIERASRSEVIAVDTVKRIKAPQPYRHMERGLRCILSYGGDAHSSVISSS